MQLTAVVKCNSHTTAVQVNGLLLLLLVLVVSFNWSAFPQLLQVRPSPKKVSQNGTFGSTRADFLQAKYPPTNVQQCHNTEMDSDDLSKTVQQQHSQTTKTKPTKVKLSSFDLFWSIN